METYNGLPLLKISLDKEEHGVDRISLVDFPAIEENWLAFSKDAEIKFSHLPEQKLAGPLLIPDKKIYREDAKGNRFYVTFSKEVIQEIAERFNKNLKGTNWNVDHEDNVGGVYISENWLIEDSTFDKSKKYGHDLPTGTWYGIVKVEDEKLWSAEIETGNLKGFSVELMSGLKMSVDSAIQDELYENHILAMLETGKIGETIPDNWTEILAVDIEDNEEDLTDEAILQMAIQSDGAAPSSLDKEIKDVGFYRVRYKYNGPLDDKNRTFCKQLLVFQGSTKIFRREDINQMSFTTSNPEFGTYSIFRFKGSFGCRHKWQRLIFLEAVGSDKEIRVGNAPKVTGRINDKSARTVNANLNTHIEMAEEKEKQKFATISELPADERVVGASVDDADGEHEVEGVKYVVADGVIAEVMEVVAEEETAEETVDAEALKKFMTDVLGWMAEKDSQIEGLVSKVNGTDESSNEQFKSITEGIEQLTVLLKLIPGSKTEAESPEAVAGTIATALQQIKEQQKIVV